MRNCDRQGSIFPNQGLLMFTGLESLDFPGQIYGEVLLGWAGNIHLYLCEIIGLKMVWAHFWRVTFPFWLVEQPFLLILEQDIEKTQAGMVI